MENVVTFQMRAAEWEEDRGERWERMQANLTAVSSSWTRDRAAPGAVVLPLAAQTLPPAPSLARAPLVLAGGGRKQMVSPETEGTACRAVKAQPALVFPGRAMALQ